MLDLSEVTIPIRSPTQRYPRAGFIHIALDAVDFLSYLTDFASQVLNRFLKPLDFLEDFASGGTMVLLRC